MDVFSDLKIEMCMLTQSCPREGGSLKISLRGTDSQKQLNIMEVTQFLFNCMRMWTLGSTEGQTKKQMEQPSQDSLERTPAQINPSITSRHSPQSASLWSMLNHSQLSPFNRSFLRPAQSQVLHSTYNSKKSTSPAPLSQDKQKEIRSMLNYLPKFYSQLQGPINSALNPLFRLILQSLPPEHPIIKKVNNFFPQSLDRESLPLQQICRKKLQLCFSNKWRQCQCQIYLLLHYLPKYKKEQSSVRAHLLNQRGILLQTLINLDSQTLLSELAVIIKKHYKKVQTLVFIRQTSEINVDFFREAQHLFQDNIVEVVALKDRKKIQDFGENSSAEIFRIQGDSDTYGYLFQKEELAVLTTRPCLLQVSTRLKVLARVIELESKVAQCLLRQDYFSIFFNRKQILLRLFAFYFNSLSLEEMLPFNKQDFLDKITTSELSNLKQQEKNTLPSHQHASAHAVSIHGGSLNCQICKKRTKTICEKCCADFNQFFGLCQNTCFEKYHQMEPQLDDEFKNQNEEEEENLDDYSSDSYPEMESLSSRARKRIKRIEMLMDDDEDDEESQSFQSIQEKWVQTSHTENQSYEALVRYAKVGLLSQSIVSKVDYLKMRIDQLCSRNSAFQLQAKQEEC